MIKPADCKRPSLDRSHAHPRCAGSAVRDYANDLPTALIAAFLWYLPVGIFVFAPPPPGVQRNDLFSAALSGILFAVVYDLLLRRRDYLLDRNPR